MTTRYIRLQIVVDEHDPTRCDGGDYGCPLLTYDDVVGKTAWCNLAGERYLGVELLRTEECRAAEEST